MAKVHQFTVQIMIRDQTESKALEKLLHLLRSANIDGYKIIVPWNADKHSPAESAIGPADALADYVRSGKLARLFVVKEKGVRMNIPCRILNVDTASSLVTVYHEDEKKVYTFSFEEIENIEPGV